MADRKKGSLVRINADGTTSLLTFVLNPTRLQISKQLVWNFLEGQGEYFAAAQFGKIGAGRQINMILFFHWGAKFDIVGADKFNADRALQTEYDMLESFTEPDVTDSQFAAELQQGRILRGVSPARSFLDYGLNLHNDSENRSALEVAITQVSTEIDQWNHKGWPMKFTAQLSMTPVLSDELALGYYQNLKRVVEANAI